MVKSLMLIGKENKPNPFANREQNMEEEKVGCILALFGFKSLVISV